MTLRSTTGRQLGVRGVCIVMRVPVQVAGVSSTLERNRCRALMKVVPSFTAELAQMPGPHVLVAVRGRCRRRPSTAVSHDECCCSGSSAMVLVGLSGGWYLWSAVVLCGTWPRGGRHTKSATRAQLQRPEPLLSCGSGELLAHRCQPSLLLSACVPPGLHCWRCCCIPVVLTCSKHSPKPLKSWNGLPCPDGGEPWCGSGLTCWLLAGSLPLHPLVHPD